MKSGFVDRLGLSATARADEYAIWFDGPRMKFSNV
jgi:hypothetical protein